MIDGTTPPLTDPALAAVMASVARRLERSGLVASGRLTVPGLTRDARRALSGLLGRPVVGDRVVLDLRELDDIVRVRLGVAGGLVAACEDALARPLVDVAAQRDRERRARNEPIERMRAIVDAWPDGTGWANAWVDEVSRTGLLARAREPGLAAAQATELVALLTLYGAGDPSTRGRRSRTELAAHHCGDAHALDDGSVLAALVLRGLAQCAGEPMPRSARDRRELWAAFDVDTDLVSTTALTLGLQAAGGSLTRRLSLAADAGDPVHLTARNVLHLADAGVRPVRVLVCENPRVLEHAADSRGGTVTMVCTMGRPTTVVTDLLRMLVASGCHLHYHGDFDWPGLAITAGIIATTGAQPWRMAVDDYLDAVAASHGRLRLEGTPTPSPWDPALAEAMEARGLAVHEEALLPGLLQAWDG